MDPFSDVGPDDAEHLRLPPVEVRDVVANRCGGIAESERNIAAVATLAMVGLLTASEIEGLVYISPQEEAISIGLYTHGRDPRGGCRWPLPRRNATVSGTAHSRGVLAATCSSSNSAGDRRSTTCAASSMRRWMSCPVTSTDMPPPSYCSSGIKVVGMYYHGVGAATG